jgi:hypothetical protein
MLVECFVYLRCFSDKVRREDIPYVDIYIANPFDIGFLRMKIRDEKTKVYFCDCAKERLNVTARTSR